METEIDKMSEPTKMGLKKRKKFRRGCLLV